MENVNKVWIYTNASKSMNHFPDCYKCNKKNRKGCTQRRIYEFFETLYIMTKNIEGVLSDKVRDGEISHKDYLTCFSYISAFQKRFDPVDFYSIEYFKLSDADITSAVVLSIKRHIEKEDCFLTEKHIDLLKSTYPVALTKTEYKRKECTLDRCDYCNLMNNGLKITCGVKKKVLQERVERRAAVNILRNISSSAASRKKYENEMKEIDEELGRFIKKEPYARPTIEHHYNFVSHIFTHMMTNAIYGVTGIPSGEDE
jgi:hypothetical protein